MGVGRAGIGIAGLDGRECVHDWFGAW
jgi:hypothetical protein